MKRIFNLASRINRRENLISTEEIKELSKGRIGSTQPWTSHFPIESLSSYRNTLASQISDRMELNSKNNVYQLVTEHLKDSSPNEELNAARWKSILKGEGGLYPKEISVLLVSDLDLDPADALSFSHSDSISAAITVLKNELGSPVSYKRVLEKIKNS